MGLFNAKGKLLLNPGKDHVVSFGDSLLVLADDDDSYQPEKPGGVDGGPKPSGEPPAMEQEKVLICGWRRDIRDMIHHLDATCAHGSQLHMMTNTVPMKSRSMVLEEEGLNVSHLKHLDIVHHMGDTSSRRKLAEMPINDYSSIIIFSEQSEENDTIHCDSHSIATLLLIRDLQYQMKTATKSCGMDTQDAQIPVVCEVLDPRTQKTISQNSSLQSLAEFCQSNKLIGQIMAMIAENRGVKALLNELLGGRGCTMSVFPAEHYADSTEEPSFWDVSQRALQDHIIILGYRETMSSFSPTFTLNPPGKEEPRNWGGCEFAAIAQNVE
jgi:hypothetical protein